MTRDTDASQGAPSDAGLDAPLDGRLDTAPCGFAAFDDHGVIRAANATLGAMLGIDVAGLVGRPIEGLLTLGGRLFWQTHVVPLLRMRGRAEELHLPLRRADGTELPSLVNAVRRRRGAAWVTDCVFVSVWERRKYEDALLAARRSADDARATAEAHRREVVTANAQMEEQQVELELSNQQLQEQAAALEMQAETLAATAAHLQAEKANADAARQAAEAERAIADAERARADEANAGKSQFLANISHELRTPLNAIGGYTQLLEMGLHGPVTDAQREALTRVQAAQRRLLALINDVLNYAKLEGGRVEYNVRRVDVREVVADIAPVVEPQLAAKRISLVVRLPGGPCVVWADREKLGQVLVNLLSNATKFTEAHHPTTGAVGRVIVDVATRGEAEDGAVAEVVFLRVSDTGCGIPRDKQAAVFEPFVQVQTGYTRTGEGTGLGLAISRDLARGMGGDLRVRSVEGEGSTFTVTLRRVIAAAGHDTDRRPEDERR